MQKIKEVIAAVGEQFELTPDEVTADMRLKAVKSEQRLARRVAIEILRENGHNYREIGKALGVSAAAICNAFKKPFTPLGQIAAFNVKNNIDQIAIACAVDGSEFAARAEHERITLRES